MLNFKRVLKNVAIFTLLSLILGCVCGLVGAAFSKSIGLASALREHNGWLLYLLPFGGLISVAVYKFLKIGNVGTVYILESAKSEKKIPKWLFVGMYIATCITHLFGGSAGKEGAALQIGAGLAETTARVLKLDSKKQNTLVLCGMSGLFSAVFGTPIAAAVFSFEAVKVEKKRFAEFLPCIVTSLSAFAVARLLGTHAERFSIGETAPFSILVLLKIAFVALAAALTGFIFCKVLKLVSNYAKKVFKNEFLRIFIGGCAVVFIILFVGREYSGSSIEGIYRIFGQEEVKYQAFIIKLILTAITMGFGYKGGEIIPSLFIGASLGAAVSMLLGLSAPLCAAVGMAALFCSVTKCPVATVFLCFEIFSGKALLYIILAAVIGRFCSFRASLYGDVKPIFKDKKITD